MSKDMEYQWKYWCFHYDDNGKLILEETYMATPYFDKECAISWLDQTNWYRLECDFSSGRSASEHISNLLFK